MLNTNQVGNKVIEPHVLKIERWLRRFAWVYLVLVLLMVIAFIINFIINGSMTPETLGFFGPFFDYLTFIYGLSEFIGYFYSLFMGLFLCIAAFSTSKLIRYLLALKAGLSLRKQVKI